MAGFFLFLFEYLGNGYTLAQIILLEEGRAGREAQRFSKRLDFLKWSILRITFVRMYHKSPQHIFLC